MTETIDTVDPIVQRLRVLMQESPDLKEAAGFYEAMLPLLRDADLHVAPVSITSDEARVKMEKGLPLLHDLDLELDAEEVRHLMLNLVTAVETIGRSRGLRAVAQLDSAARLRLALQEGRFDVRALLPHITAGDCEPLIPLAQSLQLDPDLLRTLAQNALKPALRAWCRQLTPRVGEIMWPRGYCFICGAVATLGELQGNNQVKHLRCGQCGADWNFVRLQCVYCRNEDHGTLSYLYAESQREKMRLEVCEKCKGYLKVIASFAPTPVEMLQVEDLATLHLDYIAKERGYSRVVPSPDYHS